MFKQKFIHFICFLLAFTNLVAQEKNKYFSPTDFEIEIISNQIFVVGKTANEIRAYNLSDFNLFKSFSTELTPKAIKIAGENILIACSNSAGELLVVSKNTLKHKAKIKVGFGACDVVTNANFSKAFVANQFSNDVSFVDLKLQKEITRIPVLRQPMQLEISKNGKYLFVANFLTSGRADADTVTSEISIIDIEKETVIKNIPLANGSNALRGICLSSDGKYVFISHNLGRFQVPTTQLEQGWMNTSALSIIDASNLEFVATVLLDEPEKGAAGSWGIDCTPKHIIVAHSGTHDFSVIDYPKFIEKLNNTEDKNTLSYDLRFLSGIRQRIKVTGNGPRVIKSENNLVYVANYFSDNIDVVNILNPIPSQYRKLVLNEIQEINEVRMGEIYFNDATYCFQSWQSCNGCHPSDARTDGLNWDLLNDGMGNPKNCKSMLLAHETPPAMITGIRPNAEAGVRAGFTHIQFTQIEETRATAVDKYLRSLKAVPSPYLVNGELSKIAEKGKEIFEIVGCNICHSGKWFTDLKKHNMGRQGEFDHQNTWDTPTLIETWRTGPYLHDGRSATMKDVFSKEKHGLNKELTEEEVEQLTEYVLSL
ncbi:MAG: YVTN family beta-propeller repeat-containing protein [Prolixibacteraceae bacterium]|nr:YVTN family beta-propeller repeat-containing protein [Prolixibacteraceae bacterium]